MKERLDRFDKLIYESRAGITREVKILSVTLWSGIIVYIHSNLIWYKRIILPCEVHQIMKICHVLENWPKLVSDWKVLFFSKERKLNTLAIFLSFIFYFN